MTAKAVAELLNGSYAESQWRANSQLEGDFIFSAVENSSIDLNTLYEILGVVDKVLQSR